MHSKLPHVGTTIFTVMSGLAQEHGAINLAQGFPNFDPDARLMDLVDHYQRKGTNQYAPMAGVPALNERLAALVGSCYGRSVDPATEITVTVGATQAVYTAITAFVHPGDEVVVIEPAYDSYVPAILLCGARPVFYRTQAPDFRIDWKELAQLVGPRTRMLILNTPHNPTGTICTRGDLEALSALAVEHDLLVLSDEVYEHLVFDGQRHESALRYDDLWGRCIAVFSFGKTFHCTGWRLGYAVAAAPLMKEFRKVHQYCTFSCHAPSQWAMSDYLADPGPYLSLGGFYQEKRDFFLAALEGSGFEPLPCAGTFFVLARYRQRSSEPDMAYARRLVMEQGVATIPLSPFYSDGTDEGIVRFCFAKTEATLAEAGERLRQGPR
jgi:methionine aminotransferase